MGDALAVEDQRSILSGRSIVPEPDTINKLIKRCKALINRLLPVEVEISDISDATSSIITPQVIEAFAKAGGDFGEAIPFCLLRAKASFTSAALDNPADYDENMCRATAAEVLARRIVHNLALDRLESVMSTRYRFREDDGDTSPATSALEAAIDQHCSIFLSSTEAQHVVNSLWRGEWVQKNNENLDIDYVPYDKGEKASFWEHLDPDRLSVPRYQSIFRMVVWLVFLFVYSLSVQSPLDTLDPANNVDPAEVILYVMAGSFIVEEIVKMFKIVRIAPRPLLTIGFWSVVSFLTDTLLLAAFTLRMIGLSMGADKEEQAQMFHFRSFQVLSCVAPFIWMKLLTVFDGWKTVGTLQVVVARMLRESTIFFILLTIMAVGFVQSLYALDAADGESGGAGPVVQSLVQALFGSPDFDSPSERYGYPFGLIVYYGWNLVASIILLNILIALFNSAYSDVTDNETDEWLVFQAHKTIDLIRAPDSFLYPAPFNLIEAFLIAPWEWVLSRDAYIAVNRFIMSILFFVPLALIALFESQISHSRDRRLRAYFSGPAPDEEGDPKIEDPECEDDDQGDISKVKFEELIKVFPNTAITEGAVVHHEIKALKEKLAEFEKLLKKKE